MRCCTIPRKGASARELLAMLVGKNEGQTRDTPTPVPESSPRSVSDSATTLDLVTLYGPMRGGQSRPAREATLTRWPEPSASMAGRKARQPCTGPHRFTPTIHSQSASGTCSIAPPTATPALLKSRSTPPFSARNARAAPSVASARETSYTNVRPRPPTAWTCRSVSSAAVSFTSWMPSVQPSRARWIARARPRPEPAPVTKARRLGKRWARDGMERDLTLCPGPRMMAA